MTETGQHLELEAYGILRKEIEGGRDFLIAMAKDDRERIEKRQIMSEVNGRYPIGEIPIEDSKLTVLVELNRLNIVPEDERRSRSPDSQARYLIRSEYRNPAVQVYDLKQGAVTSLHAHLKHWEWIKRLAGKAKIELNGFDQELADSIDIGTHVGHMLKGGAGGTVIACITYGPGDCFDMRDHRYLPIP